jgi:hypothetical protein
MKSIFATLTLAVLTTLTPAHAAGSKLQFTEVGKPHMEFDCASRSQLRLFVRSGEIRIMPSDDGKISVDLSGKNVDKIQHLTARLTCTQSAAELHISGGPRNELLITIHVPKTVDLYARIPAGEVTVEELSGNKDVELHAGELTIYVGRPADYGHVHASVYAGEVDAQAFGDNKGGLFRTISKSSSGQYNLYAHVGSGQLTLR